MLQIQQWTSFDFPLGAAGYRVLAVSGAVWRPPLLMLHGFTGSAQSWTEIAQQLWPSRLLIAPDLLGHGETDAPADPTRYAIEKAADDLAVLITGHFSRQPVHILGYSMGGRLAIALALRHPSLVHSLILESASPGLADPAERGARRAADHELADEIEAGGIAAFVDRWERLGLFVSMANAPAEARKRVRTDRLRQRPVGLANSLRGMGTGAQPSYWEGLGALPPTHLVVGELDTKFIEIARAMQTINPAMTLEVIPGAGHAAHVEQPIAFAQKVARWLEAEDTRLGIQSNRRVRPFNLAGGE